MKSDQISINLLKSQDKDFFTRFFEWAMLGGRFIVILTESIALMMFLYRFSLDRKLVDLHDKIKANQAILSGFQNSEAVDRDIQSRLALAKVNIAGTDNTVTIASNIVNTGRGLVTFTSFQLSEKTVKIDVSSNSLTALNKFVAALQLLPLIQTVTINSIDNHSSTGSFGLSLTVLLRS